MMKIVVSERRDPAFHLALEEIFFFEADCKSLLFLYRNSPSVIIGKHQNPWIEANLAYAQAKAIPVLRRISGGGCVVHDEGNINYSLILKDVPSKTVDFPLLYGSVLQGLRAMGLDIQTSDRNDFRIDGKKISGSAQYMRRDTTLFHGTLLFDSDLDRIHRLLDRDSGVEFESFASPSVPSPIVNLSEYLPETTTKLFLERWIQGIMDSTPCKMWQPDGDLIEKAEALAEEKYRTWEWNRGMTPPFTVKWENHEIKVKSGKILQLSDCFDQSGVGKSVPDDILRWMKEQNIS
ncbi:lipoate--protein ligase [Gottschalkiaceae bacterium SANA]|nr:lipoate--protein ligase [Gottschalkiaceae bacterium SANA]